MSPRSQPPVDALDREAVERFEHSKRLWCGATLTEPDGYRRCCTRPPHRDPIHIESEDCDPPMVARWQDEPGAAPRACYHDDWPANQREQQAIIDGAVADGLAPLWPPQGTPGDGGTIWFRWVDRGTRAVGHSEAPSGHCGEPGSAPLRVSPPASPVEPTPLPDGTVERIDDEDGARVWLITPHRADVRDEPRLWLCAPDDADVGWPLLDRARVRDLHHALSMWLAEYRAWEQGQRMEAEK